jgi:hypothetical protein
MKLKLPKNIEENVYKHGLAGREAKASGDFESAEKEFLSAWKILPAPPTQWDMSQSLTRGIIDFYISINKSSEAEKWLPLLAEAYGSMTDGSVVWIYGVVLFESNKFDAAFEKFDFLYKKFKSRPFQGYNKKYLEFYINESNKRLAE